MRLKWIYKIKSTLLLAIFLCYYGGITLFTHHHIIDGVYIVHFHFTFDKDCEYNQSGETHTHDENELILISQLTSFTTTPPTSIHLSTPIPSDKTTYQNNYHYNTKTHQVYHQIFLRGPPVIS